MQNQAIGEESNWVLGKLEFERIEVYSKRFRRAEREGA